MSSNMFDLSGRVALVTGGNGGIGLGLARGLARCGAAVMVAGRDAAKNAAAVQELMGGRFGEMSTLMNYTFQSFNFRGRDQARPYYDLIANIAAEEYSHIELVAYTINLLLTGTTQRGTDPTTTPLKSATDARNHYHFIASGQTALPVDSMGNPWTGQNVFSSGNLKLDLLHNFFLECGARANKIRVYEMVDDPTARAAVGYLLAVAVGSLIGAVVSRVSVLRRAVGSMITGLQTMPSIAWLPLAVVLFTLSERAIMFVVILGAAPSIANGLITGIDHVPPLLLRSGRMLGAGRLGMYRHVILPASLPSYVQGLKQGWAFAWRSLMAGELLVIVKGHGSIGTGLQFSRDVSDYSFMYAWMIVIFLLGVVADSLFGAGDRAIRKRWGLVENTQ